MGDAQAVGSGASALALCLALATPARAQDAALGGQLFEQGLAEMKAGAFDKGCPKLAESYRVDARPGTLFTLAECEASWGKLATAVAHYDDFLRLAGSMEGSKVQQERAKLAREQVAKLGPRVPRITLVLPADAPRGTVVSRNGVALGAPSLGVELSVDPGETTLTTQVPGGPVETQTITVAEGERKKVTLVVRTAAAPPLAPVAETAAAPPPVDRGPEGSSPLRPVAFVIGGVGVLALGAGFVTGGLALSKKGAIDDGCHGTACTPAGKDAATSAQGLATVSTATFIGGAAALALATVLFVVDKPRRPTSAQARWIP